MSSVFTVFFVVVVVEDCNFVYFYVCGCFACMYVYTLHVCSGHRGQERVSDSLDYKCLSTVWVQTRALNH